MAKIPLQQKTSLKGHGKLVDGVIFYNPSSFLFKEFARSDVLSPSLKNGYTLMIVHNDREGIGQHVISVDPASECSLEGLGALLEEKERLAEQGTDARKRKTGKERIYEEPGRHGYGVNDPWYDGRGHFHTIIDTPRSGSLLTDAEVNELVWEYLNPCKGVEIEGVKLTLFIPRLFYGETGQGGVPSETNARQDGGNGNDVLPAVAAYFSPAKKAAVKSIEIPQTGIDAVKKALFSEADLEQCNTLSGIKRCQKAHTCAGGALKSFLDEGAFAGRIDFYYGEGFKDFIPGRISFTYTRETPVDLNKYMCLQFDLIRRFRLMAQANRLRDICSSLPEIAGYRMGALTGRDVYPWGEYVFLPKVMSLSHLHDFQKTILAQLINSRPQTFGIISEKLPLQQNETLSSGDGLKLMSFNEHGGGVVVITDKVKKTPEEKRRMHGYTAEDYFINHTMLVSVFSFACFQRAVIAHFMQKMDEWLDFHGKGSGEKVNSSDELAELTNLLLKKEHGILSDQITYSKTGNDIFSLIRKRLYVDELKDRFASDLLRLNNYLMVRSNKDIAEKTNKILRETEQFEKKEKRIALLLEITILPYYLYHIGEFFGEFVYYMQGKDKIESHGHPYAFIFAIVITLIVVYITAGKNGSILKLGNQKAGSSNLQV